MTAQALHTSLAPAEPAGAQPQRLHEVPLHRLYRVRRVHPDPRVPERVRQLEEIGFYPGEPVIVMARGRPGGDPLAVRIGQSTFALRIAEAACIQVEAATTAVA